MAISLCMIVKDEAATLGQALASVKDVVDEIIVVDTGSTDDTVAIAESYGAQVHTFPWVNDFAAARNASLAHATGDWVLVIDADEVLQPEVAALLKALDQGQPLGDIPAKNILAVYEAITPQRVVSARNSYGGTGFDQVQQAIQRAQQILGDD